MTKSSFSEFQNEAEFAKHLAESGDVRIIDPVEPASPNLGKIARELTSVPETRLPANGKTVLGMPVLAKRKRHSPEADLQRTIDDIAARLGYKILGVDKARLHRKDEWIHLTPFIEPGWPDRGYFHPVTGHFFTVEFKSDKGTLSADQKDWISCLRSCNILSFVWRPRDLDFAIETVTRLAGREVAQE